MRELPDLHSDLEAFGRAVDQINTASMFEKAGKAECAVSQLTKLLQSHASAIMYLANRQNQIADLLISITETLERVENGRG